MDLRAHCPRLNREQRQVAVGRRAGQDFNPVGSLKLPETLDEVSLVPIYEGVPNPNESLMVHPCQASEFRLQARASSLPLRQFDQALDLSEVPRLEQRVLKHADQGRGQSKGQPEVDSILDQPVQHKEQRNVNLCDCLVQPTLFKRVFMLGMADEWQVTVEHQRQVSFYGDRVHAVLQFWSRSDACC